MEVQINIEFDELVRAAKKLPATQWVKLKQAVDKTIKPAKQVSDLETFLLSAPTFSKKQLNEIAKTRNAISQWRTK